MAAAITVLYPNVDDATFDLRYYLDSHMPLVMKLFGPHGITGWRVAHVVGTPTGDRAPYSVVATLEFPTPEAFKAALAAEAKSILGDVPNFSNKDPIIMIGEVVGQV